MAYEVAIRTLGLTKDFGGGQRFYRGDSPGQGPLGRGVDLSDLAVLAAATAVLTAAAAVTVGRRDLRA